MTKTYSRAVIQRTRFRNKFLKSHTEENKLFHNKQGKFWVSVLKKEVEEYFTDNRKFWQPAKPFLLDKVKCKEPITSVNNNNIESSEI